MPRIARGNFDIVPGRPDMIVGTQLYGVSGAELKESRLRKRKIVTLPLPKARNNYRNPEIGTVRG